MADNVYTQEVSKPGDYIVEDQPSEDLEMMDETKIKSIGIINKYSNTENKIYINKKINEDPGLNKKQKMVKKLLLQYLTKYINDIDHYKSHPNQIGQKPSWLERALPLFSETEIPKKDKESIVGFVKALGIYRDQHSPKNKMPEEESIRQYGLNSEYAGDTSFKENELPFEKEVKGMDINKVATTFVKENIPMQRADTREPVIDRAQPQQSYQQPRQIERPQESMGVIPYQRVKNKYQSMFNMASGSLDDIIINRHKEAPRPAFLPPEPQPVTQQRKSKKSHIGLNRKIELPSISLTKKKSNSSSIKVGAFPKIDTTLFRKIGVKNVHVSMSKKTKNSTAFNLNNSISEVTKHMKGLKNKNTALPKIKAHKTTQTKTRINITPESMKCDGLVKKLRDQCQGVFKHNTITTEVANFKHSMKGVSKIIPKVNHMYGEDAADETKMMRDSIREGKRSVKQTNALKYKFDNSGIVGRYDYDYASITGKRKPKIQLEDY